MTPKLANTLQRLDPWQQYLRISENTLYVYVWAELVNIYLDEASKCGHRHTFPYIHKQTLKPTSVCEEQL